MQPTLNPNWSDRSKPPDFVLLNKLSPRWSGFKRGECIVMTSPKNPDAALIKRIIALPGDVIKVRPRKLLGAGSTAMQDPRRKEEIAITDNESEATNLITIPHGHCWVEGDNSDFSMDSNNFGPVSLSLIDSRVEAVVWPLNRLGRLEPESRGLFRQRLAFQGPVESSLDTDEYSHYSASPSHWKPGVIDSALASTGSDP